MPQFKPGESKTATASFSNPKSAGFDYSASLCMGTDWTVMASASFHLNAGESKAIAFPVTMPASPGTYPVYFKVTCGGVLIGTFAATEEVVVAAPVSPPLTMVITGLTSMGDKYSGYWVAQANILITNNNAVAVTKGIKCQATFGEYDPYAPATIWYERTIGNQAATGYGTGVPWYEITLQPGQSVDLLSPYYYINGWHDFHQNYEWLNYPQGSYRSGVMKKYWFRIVDDQGNASLVSSIGTALSW